MGNAAANEEASASIAVECPKRMDLPIVRLVMPQGPKVEDLRSVWDRVFACAQDRDGRIALLIDARKVQVSRITAVHRQTTAGFFKKMVAFPQYKGEVIVFSNPLQRGILTAVTWLAPPAWQREVVGTIEEGEALIAKRFGG